MQKTPRCSRCAGELVGEGEHLRCELCEAVESMRNLIEVVSSFTALRLRFKRQLASSRHYVRRHDRQYPLPEQVSSVGTPSRDTVDEYDHET